MIKEALLKNEDPYDYVNNETYSLPNASRYDKRKKDKFGFEYLEDILITRDDMSKIIIHEIESDISSLKKVELSEVNENNYITKTINAYTEGLNFAKMQSDLEYLDVLANLLLSQERILEKEKMAKEYDLKSQEHGVNEIYIGTIKPDKNNAQLGKAKIKEEEDLLLKISQIKKQLELEKKIKESKKIETRNKFKMIKAINTQLENMSLEDLNKFCELLKISIDDLGLYNDLDNSR